MWSRQESDDTDAESVQSQVMETHRSESPPPEEEQLVEEEADMTVGCYSPYR